MHKLSVGCLFRNEEHSIVEWIEHYLHHGVEHFYLINDDSDDSSCKLLEPYIKNGVVTLFDAKWDKYFGRQRDMYNHYILPLVNETKWLLIVDMDEYVWSPMNENLLNILDQCSHIGQIQIEHTIFGSSGYEEQPKSIVNSFIKRSIDSPTTNPGNRKYFINCNYKFNSLNVHHATFINKYEEENNFMLLNDPYFKMNHYCCQSQNFWNNVKCNRGDSNSYRIRSVSDFEKIDINDVTDTDLLNQNIPVLTKLNLL